MECRSAICGWLHYAPHVVMGQVVEYAAAVSTIVTCLIALPAACASARKWVRERRHVRYRPRHAATSLASRRPAPADRTASMS